MTALQNCGRLTSTATYAANQSAKPVHNTSPPQPCHTTDEEEIGNNEYTDRSLYTVFRLFDANEDGVLSREEMQRALAKLGLGLGLESNGEKMMMMMMGDDDCLRFTDFESLFYETGEVDDDDEEYEVGKEFSSKYTEDVWKAFCVYDKNRDGFINAEELQTVLCGLGLVDDDHSNLSFCEDLIRRHDFNSDGLIDFAEFQTMLSMSNK